MARGADPNELEARLESLVAKACRAWPAIHVEPPRFVIYVAERLREGPPLAEQLEALHAADLYLACACSSGDAKALATFDATLLADVPQFIARISRSADLVERVRQELRQRLLMGTKLGAYTGRGPLGAWVRVAAIRIALNEKRGEGRAAAHHSPTNVAALPGAADPELDFLKSRYADEVTAALEASIRSLTVDQRNVLRMHYLDGLSIDAIAPTYRVHRSTAARWIADARASILMETQRILREQLNASPSELRSILVLVQSRLDLSIRRLVGERGEP
jgi:RNA polymerase sigma-70 factor (ECF subfamily)